MSSPRDRRRSSAWVGAVALLAAAPLAGAPVSAQQPSSAPDYRRLENEIAAGLNRYRAQLGLPPVARSPALDRVARSHAEDLAAYHPDTGADARGMPCNLHSWSAHGPWSPVCYTDDHAKAQAMWRKPAEITDGRYPGAGYEIAMSSTGPFSAETAVSEWKASPGHEGVIAERGAWAGSRWAAMGVGAGPGYAVVWFGKAPEAAPR